MATLGELARQHTDLDGPSIGHLQRMIASWGVLADLCFADLLLFAPVRGEDGRFVVVGQMRPTTSQTLHRDDLVGRIVDEVERPLVARSWRTGEIVEGEVMVAQRGERARVQCIPVRWHDRVIAVMTREGALAVGRRPGELERVYVETFERFARMIVHGEFPFPVDEGGSELPRVGDGAALLDSGGRVEYASPNAVNALHRLGIYTNAVGMRLDELGVEESAVRSALAFAVPVTEELDIGDDVVVLLRCIPLLDHGQVTGALLLLRDVTDLRRRDRLLITKDTTIREVHHRVKNNLQTISSLLRLQARRLPEGESQTALREAERRIRSIALVHEILSREAGEQVAFNEIVRPLVRMAEEGVLTPERPVRFVVQGDAGELPAQLATPLAVVITELLQNAVEHAFPESAGGDSACVDVELRNDGETLRVRVQDNGVGLPAGFDIASTKSLGLSIVRDLVTAQLGGTIDVRSDGGAVFDLRVPIPGDGADEGR